MAIEKATFGAGCFWGVETRFAELTGVIDTVVGYEGGELEHPTYKEVCTDRVIFTHNDQQFMQARAKVAELNASGTYRLPIATQIVPAATFWKAEEYHQRYLEKRGMVSCHI